MKNKVHLLEVGVTGHRDKYFADPAKEEAFFKKQFGLFCDNVQEKEIRLHVGGCPGVDYWAMEIAMEMKLRMCLYLPFDMSLIRAYRTKEEYEFLTKAFDYCNGEYLFAASRFNSRAYQMRNTWIVDSSEILLAYFKSKRSGTYNCVNYALTEGNIPVVNLLVK